MKTYSRPCSLEELSIWYPHFRKSKRWISQLKKVHPLVSIDMQFVERIWSQKLEAIYRVGIARARLDLEALRSFIAKHHGAPMQLGGASPSEQTGESNLRECYRVLYQSLVQLAGELSTLECMERDEVDNEVRMELVKTLDELSVLDNEFQELLMGNENDDEWEVDEFDDVSSIAIPGRHWNNYIPIVR
jgi:hypothetical protein